MNDPVVPKWAESDENLGRNCVTVVAVVAAFPIALALVAYGHVEVVIGIALACFGSLAVAHRYFDRRLRASGTESVREMVCDLSRDQAYEVLEKALVCLDLASLESVDEVMMSIVVTVPPSGGSTTGERVSGSIGSTSEEGTFVRFESERLAEVGAFDPRKNEQNLDEAVWLFKEFATPGDDRDTG